MVLSALVVFSLTLSGCASGQIPGSEATPSPAPTQSVSASPEASAVPAPAPAPAVPEVASLNSLSFDQLQAMVQACPEVAAAVPDTPARPIAQVAQWAIDSMAFFAATAQCGEIPVVLARDASGTEPVDMVFASPLQFIEPACAGATTVSFWAHYDDDLLFGNPALQSVIDDGGCLRTFFFTGSDAGEGEGSYALNREVGIRASYDIVRGKSGPWTDTTVPLKSGVTVTISRPDGDPRISLVFLRLPDGGLGATGYKNTGAESLPQLVTGEESVLHTLDTGQEITLDELYATVTELVNGYRATQVMAHLPGNADGSSGDHPDHRAVGRIVAAQVDAGLINPDIVEYAMGYPVDRRSPNINPKALARKLNAFSTYAAHDPVIKCKDSDSCLKSKKFGEWVQRQYLIAHNDMVRQ